MTEIAQFRERAAKREREKMRDVREAVPAALAAPSGPKVREWGKPQLQGQQSGSPLDASKSSQGYGKGVQGYSKPVGFVKAEEGTRSPGPETRSSVRGKTDEELEADRREARRRDEENSFRDVSDHRLETSLRETHCAIPTAGAALRTSRESPNTGA